MKKAKRLFTTYLPSALALTSLSFLALTSCGVSQTIKDNLVSNNGNGFIYGTNTSTIKKTIDETLVDALANKDSLAKVKQNLIDKILVDWFKSVKDEYTEWKDKWTEWNDSATDAYDDKLKEMKTSKGDNWPYYFQNDILDPIGGTKEAFIQDQINNSVRSFFVSQVFQSDKNYLAMPEDKPENSGEYKPNKSVIPTKTINLFDYSDKWQYIDFYGQAVSNYNDFLKCRSYDWAQIQSKTFDMYTDAEHPISTSMTLWKYSATQDELKKAYNSAVIKEFPSEPNYSFPLYSRGNRQDPTNGAEEKYAAFKSKSLSEFYDTNGAIRIPLQYTDDSSCLFRVNLSSDAFTTLDTTYASAASYLFQNAADASFTDLSAKASLTSTILGNFLSTAPASGEFKNLYGSTSSTVSKLFEVAPEGRINIIDASSEDASNIKSVSSAYTLDNGRFILIRENPGVHVIGLDCKEYLGDGDFDTVYEKEKDVLKMRSLQELNAFDVKEGTGINFTSPGGKMNEYFTANVNDILIEIINDLVEDAADGTIDNKLNMFANTLYNDDATPKSDYKQLFSENWAKLYDVFQASKDIDMFNTAYSNYTEANKKIIEFNKKYNDNLINGGLSDTNYKPFNSGLAPQFPFKMETSSTSLNGKMAWGVTRPLANGMFTNSDWNTKLKTLQEDLDTKIKAFLDDFDIEQIKNVKWSEHVNITLTSGNKLFNIPLYLAFNDFLNGSIIPSEIRNVAYAKYVDFENGQTLYDNKYLHIDELKSAINNQIFIDKVITSDKPYNYYLTAPTNNYIDIYKEDIIDTNLSNINETSDETLTLYKFYSTLKYLMNDALDEFANGNVFGDWVANRIGRNNVGYFAWSVKDNYTLNTIPANQFDFTPDFSTYGNNGDKFYFDDTQALTTKTSYYDMGAAIYRQAGGEYGYLGLQTKSNSTLNSTINTSLFDKLSKANPNNTNVNPEDNTGALYQYGTKPEYQLITDGITTTNTGTIVEYIIKNITNQDGINTLSSSLLNNLGYAWSKQDALLRSNQSIVTNNKPTLSEKQQIFVNLLTNGTTTGYDIPAECLADDATLTRWFTNMTNDGTPVEINNSEKNGPSDTVFVENLSLGEGWKAKVIQVSQQDFKDKDFSTLCNDFGDDIIWNLVVQCALDVTVQTRVTSSIMTAAFGNDKLINVFDRRINDALGKNWIKNFKEKN